MSVILSNSARPAKAPSDHLARVDVSGDSMSMSSSTSRPIISSKPISDASQSEVVTRKNKSSAPSSSGGLKTVSTFFKSLFNSKTSDSGVVADGSPASLPSSSKSFSVGRNVIKAGGPAKPSIVSSHGQTPSSPARQGVHHDISAPLSSSQSFVTKKPSSLATSAQAQQQPIPVRSVTETTPPAQSTLLAVSPKLPANMARAVWCLKASGRATYVLCISGG